MDSLLDGISRAGRDQQRPQLLHACSGQRHIADTALQHCTLSRVGRLSCQRDQQGALALTQVVARRLAGLGGVAEHAEQIVA